MRIIMRIISEKLNQLNWHNGANAETAVTTGTISSPSNVSFENSEVRKLCKQLLNEHIKHFTQSFEMCVTDR